jgi:hypothetical protein
MCIISRGNLPCLKLVQKADSKHPAHMPIFRVGCVMHWRYRCKLLENNVTTTLHSHDSASRQRAHFVFSSFARNLIPCAHQTCNARAISDESHLSQTHV